MVQVVDHVVVFTQENHTTDNYFRSMRAWGANVASGWPVQANPPAHDHPHTRAAYAKWLHAQQHGTPTPALHTQFKTKAVLPYYAYLAAAGAFLENHCSGFGTNSTPNHLLIVGGQSPTLRNPPRSQPDPEWDMPSLPGHAQDHGLTWKVYTGRSGYPVSFYAQLKGSANIAGSDQIVADAKAGTLPALAMVWHSPPFDEHPVADVRLGQNKVWQAVDAIAAAGRWQRTVFLLTWDDWGGWDDHVVTPNLEFTPDGVQLAYGPRVPLLMFGGPVKPGIDSRWNSHVSIGKTLLDLLGLPPLVHDGLALPAVREVLETKLKEAGRTSAYEHRRGQWVENAAIDLLVGVLPGAEVHRSFNYFVPDPSAVAPQTDPSKFTKRVEADGLILIDDVAFVVEVKSVALTAEARGGVARRLRGKLRDIVTAAANQADRLRQRIITDKRIRGDDDQWIDVSNVREIHTIAVGLEDLSGVTTATAMLVGAGVLTPDHIPWTVSLHDLRIICELLDRPSELLLYLRRRTHPQATMKYLAVDELDLYLLFLNRGLYIEPNPDEVAEALPWSGEPTVAARRRYESQQPEMVESQTEPLDAWYQAQLDPSHLTADKPALPGDTALLKLVDDITASKRPGWLSTTTMLLEGNARAQRAFGRHARDLARRVKQDGQHHSATHILTDTAGTPFVLVWACCGRDETADSASSYLGPYLSAKKHQVGAPRAALMLFDSRGTQFLRLLFDNREPGPDPDMDRAASQLVPLENMKATPPRPARPRTKSHKRKK